MSLYALILCIDFVVFYLLIFFVLSLVVIIFVFFIVFLEKVQYMERGFMYWKKIAFGCSWWYLLAFIYVLAGSYLCISMRWFWLFLAIFQGFPNNGKGWGGKSPRPPYPSPVGKTLCFAGSYLCMNKFCKVDCI